MGNRLVVTVEKDDGKLGIYWHWGAECSFDILANLSRVAHGLDNIKDIAKALCDSSMVDGICLNQSWYEKNPSDLGVAEKFKEDNDLPVGQNRNEGLLLLGCSIDEAIGWADDLWETEGLDFTYSELEDCYGESELLNDLEEEIKDVTITDKNFQMVMKHHYGIEL